MNQKSDRDTLIQVRTQATPEVTDPLRELVIVVARTRFTPTIAQRLGLATHELVENAVLYGSLGSELEYALSFETRSRTVSIQVSNAAVASRANALAATIQHLSSTSPKEAFEASLRATAASGRAKLGLARIAHEAGMALRSDYASDRVTVTASRRV